jgi:membrane associated rhomboid family serine protease
MEKNITNILIILNIIVFLIVFSMPEELLGYTFDRLSFSGAYMLDPVRWLASLFLHANASHLFFNMLALYFFGRVVEEELSAKQYVGIYLLSGVFGNLLYGLTSTALAVGASGCVFGVMGAAMLMEPKKLIRIYIIPLPLGLIAVLYMLAQVTLAAMPLEATGVGYMAHIGGLVAGSAACFYCNAKRAVKSLGFMLLMLAILIMLQPVIGLVIGIGEFILSIVDFVVGIILYGIARLLLSWIWGVFL